MFGNLKSNLKSRIKGVVEDIKGRRVDAADPYVAARPASAPVAARPAPVVAPVVARPPPERVPAAASVVGVPQPVEPPRAEVAPAELAPVELAPVEPATVELAPVEPAPVQLAPVPPAAVEPAEPAPPPPIAAKPHAASPSVASLAAAAASGKVASRVLHADMGSTDVASYLARAKANGRSADSVTGGVGINAAEDGEAYWGPVDNDSSRAKAAGKVLTIDQFECISCGTCVEQTDKVYYLPDDGKATPIAQDGPMDLIQDAIDACPVTCIAWTPPAEAEERGLATGIGAGE
ncbi:MAG: ferredoxin [Pseudomonadota bacterium]|nr:ferredoxin [Pseudomonadota bacterium]